MTMINQFSRTGLQGSLDSPKSPPVVHHVPESHEQTCGWSFPDTGCEQRPFVPHASTTFAAYLAFKFTARNFRSEISYSREENIFESFPEQ